MVRPMTARRKPLYAIRSFGTERWPCPWFGYPNEPFSMCSSPSRWPLAEARVYVDRHRALHPDSKLAVWRISGFKQVPVYPPMKGLE